MRPRTLIAVLLLLLAGGCGSEPAPADAARQAEVAERGAEVMPFDLERTMHVFDPTGTGGVQQVVVRDSSDAEQIELIRRHLQEEANLFQHGDFGDPARIHGAEMPGLRALSEGAGRIDIAYRALPKGAQITYRTDDPALVRAIHHWFAAQRSDHGAHARVH